MCVVVGVCLAVAVCVFVSLSVLLGLAVEIVLDVCDAWFGQAYVSAAADEVTSLTLLPCPCANQLLHSMLSLVLL